MLTRRLRGLVADDVGGKDWVNFAKGVAIILVVLYHSMLFLRSIEFEGGGMGRAKTALEMFPMPVFLAIAGMYHQRVVTWTLGETWRRRLLGYLYLYVLWSVIRFAFYLVVPNVRSDGAGSYASDPLALLTILVWPISSYWFILALAVFTLVLWLVRKLPPWIPITGAAVLSIAFSTGFVTVRNVGWDRMGEYLVFFLVGALAARKLFAAVPKAPWWVVPASLAVYGASAAVAAFVPAGSRVPGVVLVGQVAAVVFGATASHLLVRLRPLSWVSYLGTRSLHLYLIHVFVIAGLAAVVQALPQLSLLPGRGFLVLGAMVVLVIAISALLGRLLSRVSWLYVPPRLRRRTPPSSRTDGSAVPASEPARSVRS
ncbi:acyltransferase family protein [Naasia sp. SYSU D00948]|uniref:acyltransferase family protein n=1 Tax=Naasia sp. SYSU D00948 TaxID=2817379 RepID=UPI001B301110|nr:acyltransferase family protein [Naasia sp. SYSU D00948]